MSKFIMSYSCGKDSTLALHRMIKNGHEPVCLIVTVKKDEERSWFHGVPNNILDDVSKSLNIPLVKIICEPSDYESKFEEAINYGKNLGAEVCAFGDIDIEAHRKWCTDRTDKCNIESVFPLWQEDREKLTFEFINNGYSAIIKCCNGKFLGEEFLGKKLTKELVEEIKDRGADPCGENGEYHTFVYDGPIFKNNIIFNKENKFENNGYHHLVINK